MQILFALVLLSIGGSPGSRDPALPGGQRPDFQVQVNELLIPYRMMGVFFNPGQMVRIEVHGVNEAFVCLTEFGLLRARGLRRWDWRAPREPGIYRIEIIQPETLERVTLHAFVLHPRRAVAEEHLNGYRIGSYPVAPLRGLEVYKPPQGFVEVTRDNVDMQVSPHFTLGQFVCKQDGGYPKYAVIRERLLLKLERLLEMLQEEGHSFDSLHIMSGYRTPWYNAAIGNGIFSRHVYGDAADVFPDQHPEDGQIDDLNGDGKSDYRDAVWLYDLIESASSEPWYGPFVGGMGRYRSNRAHGPFLHVDARGFRARW